MDIAIANERDGAFGRIADIVEVGGILPGRLSRPFRGYAQNGRDGKRFAPVRCLHRVPMPVLTRENHDNNSI